MWLRFNREVAGVLVPGDITVPPTTFWNWPWMVFSGWKMVAVLRVADGVAARGYYIGYRPTVQGRSAVWKQRLQSDVFHAPVFRMRIGREPCTFFAIGVDGTEECLELVVTEDIKRGRHRKMPLR